MEYLPESAARAARALATLPGVGAKTALRLTLHLLRRPAEEAEELGRALLELRQKARRCAVCNNLSEEETCRICRDSRRRDDVICVVSDIRDLIALERAAEYQGRYHVLGGLVNPMEGVGPDELCIEPLLRRAEIEEVQEVIFALSSSMEGETTAFYLAKKLRASGVKLSHIARGVPVGSDLEYADELTLARALQYRTRYGDAVSSANS